MRPTRSLRRHDPCQVRRVISETEPKFSAQNGHPCGQFSMTTSHHWSRMRHQWRQFDIPSGRDASRPLGVESAAILQPIMTALAVCGGQSNDSTGRLFWWSKIRQETEACPPICRPATKNSAAIAKLLARIGARNTAFNALRYAKTAPHEERLWLTDASG